jgi:multidrug efflux system membrane fusion protein
MPVRPTPDPEHRFGPLHQEPATIGRHVRLFMPPQAVGFGCGRLVPAVAFLLVLAGCKPADTVVPPPPPVPVQVAVAVRQDMPREFESIGAVQALRTVSVKSQTDGLIAEIHFKEGDEVGAGDLLVTLDSRPFENMLNIARANLANARAEAVQADADAERYKRLDQSAAISKSDYTQYLTKAETAHAQVQAMEAAVTNAELQLSYTAIRAPIAGRTGQLLLHEGSLVKANDNAYPLVTINQLAPIAVAFAVPEDALEEIRAAIAARRASVKVAESSSGLVRTDGALEFVDNAVDTTTGTITLKAVFPNADHSLWPGRFVQVVTQVGVDHDALVVPAAAVMTGQTGSTVYVVKPDQTVELRTVTVARVAGDQTLLAGGVAAGETIVTDGQLRLLPGAKTEIRTPSGQPVAKVAVPAPGQKS